MQDSLEDYIKIKNNTKPDELPKITKEIQITAQRKKECDARAMKIVEFSIEGKLRPEIFTKCLPFINQSYYQDIVEERAITKLCGYSICGKQIPDMPKKQYFISTKSNKVYDISDRKNYCSNFCYKASLHVKKQIDNSPLWLRKLEDMPEYQLLDSTETGFPGEYVDQGVAKPVVEHPFTSVSVFTEASLNDAAENEKGREKIKGKGKRFKLLKSTMQTINENGEQGEEEESTTVKREIQNSYKKVVRKKHEQSNCVIKLPVIDENEEKTEIKVETIESVKENSETSSKTNLKKIKKKSTKAQKIDVESLIQKVVKEWLTLESCIFIHGESKVKEVLNENKLRDCFDELNITELQRDQQIKYMEICKRLQLQEIADEKYDKTFTGNAKLKPIPDYKKLKEESKNLNIQVKCFYSGVLQEREDTNFPTKVNESTDVEEEEGPPAVLPLVDVNSQNAMRRKIFLSSISKSMQQLLQALTVTNFSCVMADLQTLVKTFKLKADNIVFKPILWNYIAILLLNILSLRDQNLKDILEEKHCREYIGLQLSLLPSKIDFFSDIINNIQNVESFVKDYISAK